MFDVAQVSAVYSGRKGCACGCRGKYSYASAFKCDRPSYMDGDEGVNDRTVRMMAKKVERMVREGNVERVHVAKDGAWMAVDVWERTYTVYFGSRRTPAAANFMDSTG